MIVNLHEIILFGDNSIMSVNNMPILVSNHRLSEMKLVTSSWEVLPRAALQLASADRPYLSKTPAVLPYDCRCLSDDPINNSLMHCCSPDQVNAS